MTVPGALYESIGRCGLSVTLAPAGSPVLGRAPWTGGMGRLTALRGRPPWAAVISG